MTSRFGQWILLSNLHMEKTDALSGWRCGAAVSAHQFQVGQAGNWFPCPDEQTSVGAVNLETI